MNKFKPGDRVKIIQTADSFVADGFTKGSEWLVKDCDGLFVYIDHNDVLHPLFTNRFELVQEGNPSFVTPPRIMGVGEASAMTVEKSVCTCDFITQILPYGCKCGGA